MSLFAPWTPRPLDNIALYDTEGEKSFHEGKVVSAYNEPDEQGDNWTVTYKVTAFKFFPYIGNTVTWNQRTGSGKIYKKRWYYGP